MSGIRHCSDYGEMSRLAAARVIAVARAKPDLLLCAPTGNSPAGLYRELIREHGMNPALLGQLRVVKLDEWMGVPPGDPASCEHALRTELIGPLAVSAERYLSFDAQSRDPARECARVRAELQRRGPIDVCILGLGRNGHIGLNEPAANYDPHCHVAKLTAQTLQHSMLRDRDPRPDSGLTLGIGDLLASRRVLLLVTGPGKEPVIERFLERKVSGDLPASFLWLHPQLEVFVDDGRR